MDQYQENLAGMQRREKVISHDHIIIALAYIALDKVLFFNQKSSYIFSYFSAKTYVVGTH